MNGLSWLTVVDMVEDWSRGQGHGTIFLKKFFNINSFMTDSTSWVGAEREGDTELKQAPGSELSAQSPMQGLNSRAVRS